MVRFYIDKNKIKGDTAVIDGGEFSHAKNAYRLREKDEIDLIDGTGFIYNGRISKILKTGIEVEILNKEKADIEPRIKIILYHGVIKLPKLELILEKGVELGIYEFAPVYTERTQYKLSHAKLERMKKIVKTAVCQCGRSIFPEVKEPCELKDIVSKIKPNDLNVFLNEAEKNYAQTIKNLFSSAKNKKFNAINLVLGPEGGFTPEEALFLRSHNFHSVTLGGRILRAETAAIAALAVLMAELD